MTQHDYDEALRSAIRRSRVEVDGSRVDPWEVVVGPFETTVPESPLPLVLTIGRAFVEREMGQWSLIPEVSLIKTIEESLIENAGGAMQAYLGMIRGDYRPEDVARRAGLRWLPWLRPPRPLWVWAVWNRVRLSDDEQDVVIDGRCVPISASRP